MKKHIDDMLDCLYNQKFSIVKEVEGNDHDISMYWLISHIYYPNQEVTICFEGLSDYKVLPIELSYGCYLCERPDISLYFNKNNNLLWKENMLNFFKDILNFVKDT